MLMKTAFIACILVLVGSFPTQAAPKASGPASRPAITSATDAAGNELKKFLPATREEAAAAIQRARTDAAEVQKKLGVQFATIESLHFLVFTDWDKREHDFLHTNMEQAYEAVSRQFEIPLRDNVFVGKLPVYMFTRHDDFKKYANEIDEFAVPDNIAGYYRGNSLGFGHMAMWKPDNKLSGGDIKLAEKMWAYTLVHEFTHAFVARYRTNAFVPRWLNEGVAEVVASRQFPRPSVYSFVRGLVGNGKSCQAIFQDKGLLTAADYPIAQTVVETLIAGDRRAFLQYFNDIKDGSTPDDALEKNYRTDRKGLEEAWKKYMRTAR